MKLELELKETRELEKSHRYHLQASREMMENLQETVTQLVHLKRDVKKMKDEIVSKEMTLASMQKVVINCRHKFTFKKCTETLRKVNKYVFFLSRTKKIYNKSTMTLLKN